MPDAFGNSPPPRGQLKLAPRSKTKFEARPTLGQRLDEWRKIVLNFAFMLLVSLFVFAIGKLLTDNNLVVEPIGLPKNIRELGYTEDATAQRIAERMAFIASEAQSGEIAVAAITRADFTEIDVPVADVSMSSVVRLLRQALAIPQHRVVGDFVCPSEPCVSTALDLRLRYSDGRTPPRFLPVVKATSPDGLVIAGAEAVMRVADPLNLALYYFENNSDGKTRQADALEVAREMIASNHPASPHAYNILGIELLERPATTTENLAEAIGHFQKAVDANPAFGLAYINWAAASLKLGQFEDARNQSQKALGFLPDQIPAYVNLGIAQAKLKQRGDAEQTFNDALAISPGSASVLNAYGMLLIEWGEPGKAIDKLQEALVSQPVSPNVQFHLGVAYEATGNKPAAISAFQAYLKLSPDADDRQDVEATIAQLSQ